MIEFGARAIRRLLAVKDGSAADAPRHEVVGTELVVRRSCGATAAKDSALDPTMDRRRRHS
jgi:hypothetical protein